MGNAALLARAAGHEVTGADSGVYPPMSTVLAEAGVAVHEGYDPDAARLAETGHGRCRQRDDAGQSGGRMASRHEGASIHVASGDAARPGAAPSKEHRDRGDPRQDDDDGVGGLSASRERPRSRDT